MKKKWQKFLSNGYVDFILKTIFYFAVLFALVYLYSYSGVNQPHFIYNEF
ncbi:teichoic acid D-Ala incorporation-associated protein DltX [Ligilactobacillus faecis]|uniref:Teichoic acid D-Ala incorporation-associated protein DltX n=1 Tax=Ligilactobacillus faecis TaxID=762833 RepID=A0ABV4DMW1_9LACO|nr:teichoic acid D-Ala incorporation-associated protein DltX [Ligilactobacillus faecis]WGN89265.1 teichoic acid D-Ala incorporation-associated protein DltX [Ligilactobacillus faecis]